MVCRVAGSLVSEHSTCSSPLGGVGSFTASFTASSPPEDTLSLSEVFFFVSGFFSSSDSEVVNLFFLRFRAVLGFDTFTFLSLPKPFLFVDSFFFTGPDMIKAWLYNRGLVTAILYRN